MTQEDRELALDVGAAAGIVLDEDAAKAELLDRYVAAVHHEAEHGLSGETDPEVGRVFRDAAVRLDLTLADIASDVAAVRSLGAARAAIVESEKVLSTTRSPEQAAKITRGLKWYRSILLTQLDAATSALHLEGERWKAEQAADQERRTAVRRIINNHPRVLSGERP